MERPDPRRGSILPVILLMLAVASILGLSFMTRAIRSQSTGAWSADHVIIGTLVDSATEEAWALAQLAANDPAAETFRTLRTLPVGSTTEPTPLPGLELRSIGDDVAALESTMGGRIALTCTVGVREVMATGPDPLERVGVAVFDAGATLTQPGRPPVVQKVRVEREFRLSRILPPRPLDRAGIFIKKTTSNDLARFEGKMALSPANGGPHKLLDLLTRKSRDGFYMVPPGAQRWIQFALDDLAPLEMRLRAHLVVQSPAELTALLAGRSGSTGSLNGVMHMAFPDPVTLDLPRFAGRCLLSFSGPVTVKDVRAANPALDTLTIVSSDRITVAGSRIEASLINPSDDEAGMVFTTQASVLGCVASGRFPRSSGITPQVLGECQFSSSPSASSGPSSEMAPDSRMMAGYVALFSPTPLAVQHVREGEGWVAW